MRVIFNGANGNLTGGPPLFGAAFQQAMREHGFDAIGLLFRYPDRDEANEPEHIETAWGPAAMYPLDYASRIAVYDPEPGVPDAVERVADRVVDILSIEAPDIVVLNGFSLLNWYLARAAERLKIPFFFNHLGLWFAEIPPTLPAAAQARLRKMEEEAVGWARANIYLNAWSQERLREAYPGVRRDDDVEIPLPFPRAFLKAARPSLASDGRPTIGFVGRWDPIKSVGLVRQLAESSRDLRVVSPIAVGNRPSLKDEEWPFRQAVEILPPTPHEALAGFYRSCDLMILPSRFDVCPTVVMEAALQGRATVISRNTGWTTVYEDLDMNDWIVPTLEPEALERTVRNVLGRSLPETFLARVRERHDPARVFDAWASLITTRL